MTISEELLRSTWYGPVADATSSEMLAALRTARTPDEFLLAALDAFKAGDFTPRAIVIDLLNTVRHQPFTDFAVRVLSSVATHEDLADTDTMSFLTNAAPSTVLTFARSTTSLLSVEAVPTLLALLGEWEEDPEVAPALRQAMDSLVPFEDVLGATPGVEAVAEHVGLALQEIDRTEYAFHGRPVHPSLLTRRLVERASIAAASGEPLGIIVPPSLLSIWTGRECPVDYDTPMDGERLAAVHSYVNELQAEDWASGAKYFYGHRVR